MSKAKPIHDWLARDFEQWRESSDATDAVAAFGEDGPTSGGEVLAAVAHCARYGIAMPPALARAFLDRYEVGAQHRVDSWDDPDAFDSPRPLGNKRHVRADKLASDRLRERYRFAMLAFERRQLADPKGERGAELLDAMAECFDVGSRNTISPFLHAAKAELEAMPFLERECLELQIAQAVASGDWAPLIQPART